MAKVGRVKLIEYGRGRAVLEIDLGRIVVEPDAVRFHKNRKGRGVELLGRMGDAPDDK
jgi:hypothetical protein